MRTGIEAGLRPGMQSLAAGPRRTGEAPDPQPFADGDRLRSLEHRVERGEARTFSPGFPAASDSERAAQAGGIPLRVLVVEDDGPVREHAIRVVRSFGYDVRAASSGPEALRLLAEDIRCDLLLTDVVMPGMSGGQLAQAVRMLIPDLPVVFVTGHNADSAVEQLRRDGGAVLLPKPYRRQALAAALQTALDRR